MEKQLYKKPNVWELIITLENVFLTGGGSGTGDDWNEDEE